MKWIAYFLLLFFTLGCDNSESEEDLELMKRQAEVIHNENQQLTAIITEYGYDSLDNFQVKRGLYHTIYNQLNDSLITQNQLDSIKSIFNTQQDITNQLELTTLYYNSIYTEYPTEEFPRPLSDSNFVIQTELTNNNDSLKINLYVATKNQYKSTYYHSEELTLDEIITRIEKKTEIKTLLRARDNFYHDNRYPKIKQFLNNYLETYNNSNLLITKKSKQLNIIEKELNLFFSTNFYKLKDTLLKEATSSKSQLVLNKIDFLNSYKSQFGAGGLKFLTAIPDTKPVQGPIMDYAYLINNIELISNKIPIKRSTSFSKTNFKIATKDIKTDFIQLDVEFEQEYGKPKHYKTNKVPFKIIGYE